MLMGYSPWRNFVAVTNRAITACVNSGYFPKDHFAHASEIVVLGSGAKHEIDDITLTPVAS
jgi:hypothetical protein